MDEHVLISTTAATTKHVTMRKKTKIVLIICATSVTFVFLIAIALCLWTIFERGTIFDDSIVVSA